MTEVARGGERKLNTVNVIKYRGMAVLQAELAKAAE